MAALVILSLGGNDFEKVIQYYKKKGDKPTAHSLVCFATLGMMDFVILADDSARSWVDGLLLELGLRIGFQGISPDGLTQVYMCEFSWPGDLSALVSSRTLCLLRREERAKHAWDSSGWATTDGSFQHLTFFDDSLPECIESRVLSIRKLGLQSFCMPLLAFDQVLSKRWERSRPQELVQSEDSQGFTQSLVRLWVCVEPGYEQRAHSWLTKIVENSRFCDVEPKFHFIHGQADLVLTPEIGFSVEKLVHQIWTRPRNSGILAIHAFLHHPMLALGAEEDSSVPHAGRTRKSPVSPFMLPLVIAGRDWVAKRDRILEEFQEICRRAHQFHVKPSSLDIRLTPGEAGPQIHQEKRDSQNDRLYLELSHRVLESKHEAQITHELHLAFSVLALDQLKERIYLKNYVPAMEQWREATEMNHREHFYRFVGEAVATALGLWKLGVQLRATSEQVIEAYVRPLRPNWDLLDSGRWMRLVVGYFLYEILVSRDEGEADHVLFWIARVSAAESHVRQVVEGLGIEVVRSKTSEHPCLSLARDVFFFGLWSGLKHLDLRDRLQRGRMVYAVTWNTMIDLLFKLCEEVADGRRDGIRMDWMIFDLLAGAEPDLEEAVERRLICVAEQESERTQWGKFLNRLLEFNNCWIQLPKPKKEQGADELFAFYRRFSCDVRHLELLARGREWQPEFVGEASAFRRLSVVLDEGPDGAALERASCGFEFLTGIWGESKRRMSFFEQLKVFVSNKSVQGPSEDPSQLSAGALLRRMDTDLRALEASLEYLRKDAIKWQKNIHPEAFISFNATPWLLFPQREKVCLGGHLTPFLTWRFGNPWFEAYRKPFFERACRLIQGIERLGYRPVIELVEGVVPLGASNPAVEGLWELLGELKISCNGKMGLAVDDMFGPGTDLKRLVQVLERAMRVGFNPLIIKVDFSAVSSILWQGQYEKYLRKDEMPWHWKTAFSGIFQLVLSVIQVLHENEVRAEGLEPPRFCLVVEGFDGPDQPKTWREEDGDFGAKYRKFFAKAVQDNGELVLNSLPNLEFRHTAQRLFEGILLQGR